MKNEKLVLIDADVLIHLFKANKITLLNELFPDRCRMLDVVLNELRNNRTIRGFLDSIFLFSKIQEISMPGSSNGELLREFATLKNKILGDGERATLLYCKYHQHIIASSNTKDIKPFCEEHGIAYITTLDIFCIAIFRGAITVSEVDSCIKKINMGSFLCCGSIEAHQNLHFDPAKIHY